MMSCLLSHQCTENFRVPMRRHRTQKKQIRTLVRFVGLTTIIVLPFYAKDIAHVFGQVVAKVVQSFLHCFGLILSITREV